MISWVAVPALLFAINMHVIGREFPDRERSRTSLVMSALACAFATSVYFFSVRWAATPREVFWLFDTVLDVGISLLIIAFWATSRVLVGSCLHCGVWKADQVVASSAAYAAGAWCLLRFFLACRL